MVPPSGISLPDILLISQVFPPAVGGSGELLANVYSRIVGPRVTVLTDAATCPAGAAPYPELDIRRLRLNGHCWGMLDARCVAQHFSLARKLWALSRRRPTVIHCGRAQPEAIPARLASHL